MFENELKAQFSELLHEIIKKNRKIVSEGDYGNLLSLCEQDITILGMLETSENITAKEISNRLQIPKTTIVTAVSRLVKRGYIERRINEEDKRELFLYLTNKGKKANKEHFEYEDILLESLVSRWQKSEQKELAKLLKKRRTFDES